MRTVTVARKPPDGTIVENVAHHGTGPLNLEQCRIPGKPRATGTIRPHSLSGVNVYGKDKRANRQQQYDANLPSGRWPANVILHGIAVVASIPLSSYFKQINTSQGD